MSLKVLVCSASSDKINRNALLRNFVGRGFAELLTAENVLSCSLDYAVEATRQLQPELVIIFGSCMPDNSDYSGLKSYCVRSGATMVFWLHDDPYEFDYNFKIYNYADFIFSNDKWAVTHIEHPRVFHLPLAADPQTHYRTIQNEFVRDMFFCGVGFPNRIQLLSDCANALSSFLVDVYGDHWPEALKFCYNYRINNEALPDYYAASLVTLNIGRRFNIANSRYQLDATTPGPRTFEAAMAGAVQCVHFEQPEILDYFTPGKELFIFDDAKELADIINQLKENPELRLQMANAAQDRVNKEHTYKHRASKMLELIGI